MDTAKEVVSYIITHGPAIGSIILMILGVSEAVVRLTPTKKDDGAVERIGKGIRKVLDMAGKFLPNNKKGGGAHPPLAEKEESKDA